MSRGSRRRNGGSGCARAVQRALVLGRLYGGAIVIGTSETDPAALARPLAPDRLPVGGLAFVAARSCSPLSPKGPPSGAQPGISGTSTTLQSIEMPIGLTLNARGETIIQRANNYAEEARNALAFNPASPKYEEGESWPDGVRDDDNTGAQVALEAKYLGNSEKGLRDPGRNVSFINQKDVDQARKYLDKFKGGLLWVTNNADLADKYERMFEGNGLSGVRVVFIPSREE